MTLTPNGQVEAVATAGTEASGESHTDRVSTTEFLAFTRRIIRAMERRAGDVDPEALAELAGLQADLARVVETAVGRLRNDPEYPASWATIGDAFGITRQAAQMRFKHLGGARVAGGQPASLR